MKTLKELTRRHQELKDSMTGKMSEVYESLDKKYPVDMEVIAACVAICSGNLQLVSYFYSVMFIPTIQELVKEGEKAALREFQGFKKEITEKAKEGSYSVERWNGG